MAEEDNHWHLDKRLNVGHLITTLSLAGAMVVWAMTIETRVAEHSIQIGSIASQIERVESRNDKNMSQLTTAINRINDKLDRLIERQ